MKIYRGEKVAGEHTTTSYAGRQKDGVDLTRHFVELISYGERA
jgi:hypothetical protein